MGVESLFRELWSGVSSASPSRLPDRFVPHSKAPSAMSSAASTSDSDSEVDAIPFAKPSTEAPDMSQHSDPSVNTDRLPDDHPIYLLEEARKFYRGRQPPFVLHKRSEFSKHCVVPTKDGLRPKVPTKVQIIAKSWDDKLIFWTVDLNHKRYIVKAFPGGKGQSGAKYLHWAGAGQDFQEPPLALSEFSSTNLPPKSKAPFKAALYTSSEDEDEAASDQSRKRRRHTVSEHPSFDENEHENETIPARTKRLRVEGSSNPLESAVALQPIDNYAEPGSPSHETSDKNARKAGKQPKRHSELPLRTSHHRARSQESRKRRRRTEISSREISQLYSVPPPSLRPSGTQRPARSTLDPQVKATSDVVPFTQQNTSSAGLFAKLFASQSAPQLPTKSAALSEHKVSRTTFIVRITPSSEYQPLKLSECTDLSTFFTKVLGAWALAEEDVGKVTVTFNWMDENDKLRTMFMNPNQEACWTHLIEEIEDAPCWDEEKGKCFLDIEIVLRE